MTLVYSRSDCSRSVVASPDSKEPTVRSESSRSAHCSPAKAPSPNHHCLSSRHTTSPAALHSSNSCCLSSSRRPSLRTMLPAPVAPHTTVYPPSPDRASLHRKGTQVHNRSGYSRSSAMSPVPVDAASWQESSRLTHCSLTTIPLPGRCCPSSRHTSYLEAHHSASLYYLSSSHRPSTHIMSAARPCLCCRDPSRPAPGNQVQRTGPPANNL